MRAGRLRHRLILQSKSYTRNAYGEAVNSWVTEATVWGAIEPLSGREWMAQQQVQSEANVRIVLRYYSGLDPSWRIRNGSKFYNIVDVINHDERNAMMTLMCREGVSEDLDTAVPDSALYFVDGDPMQFVDTAYWERVA